MTAGRLLYAAYLAMVLGLSAGAWLSGLHVLTPAIVAARIAGI